MWLKLALLAYNTTEHAEAKDHADVQVESVEVDAMGDALEDMISPRPGTAPEVELAEETLDADVQQLEVGDDQQLYNTTGDTNDDTKDDDGAKAA
jgi:hypothetical protein